MSGLFILTGPSCVGKGPLCKALARLRPDLCDGLRKVVLHNSRPPRPGERDGVDYHFRSRDEIEALRDDPNFTVMEVRGDLQAFKVDAIVKAGHDGWAFFEGNPFVARVLLEADLPEEVRRVSAFLSPLCKEELVMLNSPGVQSAPADFVANVMRRKLLRRATRQKGILSLPDLEEVERRATSAYTEMKEAWRFDWIVPNHDGEDSENWDAFYYPVGDARLAIMSIVDLMENRSPRHGERWSEELIR